MGTRRGARPPSSSGHEPRARRPATARAARPGHPACAPAPAASGAALSWTVGLVAAVALAAGGIIAGISLAGHSVAGRQHLSGRAARGGPGHPGRGPEQPRSTRRHPGTLALTSSSAAAGAGRGQRGRGRHDGPPVRARPLESGPRGQAGRASPAAARAARRGQPPLPVHPPPDRPVLPAARHGRPVHLPGHRRHRPHPRLRAGHRPVGQRQRHRGPGGRRHHLDLGPGQHHGRQGRTGKISQCALAAGEPVWVGGPVCPG